MLAADVNRWSDGLRCIGSSMCSTHRNPTSNLAVRLCGEWLETVCLVAWQLRSGHKLVCGLLPYAVGPEAALNVATCMTHAAEPPSDAVAP
jgi:hypothetical protein